MSIDEASPTDDDARDAERLTRAERKEIDSLAGDLYQQARDLARGYR